MRTRICYFIIIIIVALSNVNHAFAQSNSVSLTSSTGSIVNYSSISTAYFNIPAPVTANYVIELLPAYNGAFEIYPITLGDKGLMPGGFTITIRPAAGNNGETIQRITPFAGTLLSINGR